jgi:hypothetical protein
MGRKLDMQKSLLVGAAVLSMLAAAGNALAADRYRVSAEFFHLGEMIGKPVLEVEAGVTAAGSWMPKGWGQYTVAALVRPVADGQVYVSLQFSSGNIDIQPNLLVEIGKQSSFTVKKVRMELLVEDLGGVQPAGPMQPLQLTQNSAGGQPR